MKKLTIGYVEKKTKELAIGYECLSTVYVGATSKLEFRCDKGHVYKATWGNFKTGTRCSECAGLKKLTIEYVKKKTKELAFGYECLSDIYVNANSKLKFRCDKGHEYETSWHSMQSGRRCSICARNVRFDIDKIKHDTALLLPGYVCLSTTYKNNRTKLKFRCDKGHEYETIWDVTSKGHRCQICTTSELAESRRFTIEYVKEMAFKLAPTYKLLSEEYTNSKSKLKFRCDKGHIYTATLDNFSRGTRCPECALKRQINILKNRRIRDEQALQNITWYRVVVSRYSNENYCKYYYLVNPDKLERSYIKYHLDHIYTVIDGFNNNILPQIIASPVNLQMLSAHDNICKKSRSDITKEELFKRYEKFDTDCVVDYKPPEPIQAGLFSAEEINEWCKIKCS